MANVKLKDQYWNVLFTLLVLPMFGCYCCGLKTTQALFIILGKQEHWLNFLPDTTLPEFRALTASSLGSEKQWEQVLWVVGEPPRNDSHVFPNQTIFVSPRNDVPNRNSAAVEGSGRPIGAWGRRPEVAIQRTDHPKPPNPGALAQRAVTRRILTWNR